MGPTTKRYNTDLKLRALAYYDKVRNKQETARMFGVTEASVRRWVKDEHNLRVAALSAPRRRGVGLSQTDEARSVLETSMKQFVQRCQMRGVKARYDDLLAHASQLRKLHKIRGLRVTLDWVREFVKSARLVCKCERLNSAAVNGETVPNKPGNALKMTQKVKSKGFLLPVKSAVKASALKFLKRAKKLQSMKGTAKTATNVRGNVVKKVTKKPVKLDKKQQQQRRVHAADSKKTPGKTIKKPKQTTSGKVKAKKPTPGKVKKPKGEKVKVPKPPRTLAGKTQRNSKTLHPQKGKSKHPSKTASTKKTGKRQKLAKVAPSVVHVANKTLKKARQIINHAKKLKTNPPAGAKRTTPQIKRLRPRKLPTKVFRTRYRIKEMHRRIEESRASDFFDFFYGLGLIPVNRSPNDSLCLPLVSAAPEICDNSGFICDLHGTGSHTKPSTPSGSLKLGGCKSPTHTASLRYPIWTPLSKNLSSLSSNTRLCTMKQSSPIACEEHVGDFQPFNKFGRSTLPEARHGSLFEKLQSASLESEKALSPGKSPITPEQLAVVKKLFPPIGQLKFPKHCDTQLLLSNPAVHSDLSVRKTEPDQRSLRPRTSQQVEKLSNCSRNRPYRKRRRTLSEPSESTSSTGPLASDIDWLSADGFSCANKKSRQSVGTHLWGAIEDVRSCFRKEHFEETADLRQDISSVLPSCPSKMHRTCDSAQDPCSVSGKCSAERGSPGRPKHHRVNKRCAPGFAVAGCSEDKEPLLGEVKKPMPKRKIQDRGRWETFKGIL